MELLKGLKVQGLELRITFMIKEYELRINTIVGDVTFCNINKKAMILVKPQQLTHCTDRRTGHSCKYPENSAHLNIANVPISIFYKGTIKFSIVEASFGESIIDESTKYFIESLINDNISSIIDDAVRNLDQELNENYTTVIVY